MGFIRQFTFLALVAALAGCASFNQWLDDLEGKETPAASARSTAAKPQAASKQPASPPPKPAPPPPTWTAKFPGGATLRFGTVDCFPEIDPMKVEMLFAELCSAGWTQEYHAYPQLYVVQVDNRKGKTGLKWAGQDRVLAAGDGRTFEQETSFRYAAVLKRFGGHEQAVLPGTSAIVPVAFASSLPMLSLTTVCVQSNGASITLACDKPRESTAEPAAPAR